jgi:hypothetical protein
MPAKYLGDQSMSIFGIRNCALALSALAIVACSESPVSPTPEAAVKHSGVAKLTQVGTGATWYFKARVYTVWNNTSAQVDDLIEGSITFKFTSDDIMPEDLCRGYRYVESSATYTLRGTTYTVAGPMGQALAYTTVCMDHPWVQVNARNVTTTAQIELFNPANTEDFPLTPPALGNWPYVFSVWNDVGDSFSAFVTEVYAAPQDPQTKNDCMKNGWAKFGFKNQGQCVRFIETGKDSR